MVQMINTWTKGEICTDQVAAPNAQRTGNFAQNTGQTARKQEILRNSSYF
jgi:hypothetical protein